MTVPDLAHETNTRVFEGESGMTRTRNIVEVHSKPIGSCTTMDGRATS